MAPNAYSYLFDGQLGHLDYGFASASLLPQVTGADAWHINADEVDLFDYNDEVRDSPGESTFEEKPDGSALVPPRVVFQPGTPYRASDHDPVLVGLFAVADLAITKTDGVTTAVPGGSVTYTITASNAGPDPATGGTVADTFPAVLTCTWTCVGAGGGTCTASGSGNINDTVNLPVGAQRDLYGDVRDQRLGDRHARQHRDGLGRRGGRLQRGEQQRDRHRHADARRRTSASPRRTG